VARYLGEATTRQRASPPKLLSSVGHTRAPASGIDFENLSGDKGYQPLTAYGQSKMANLLFAKELQRRFAGTKKTAYAVHPGVVATNLARNLGPVLRRVLSATGPLFLKSVAEGAATEVFAAVSPKALPLAGSYLSDSNVEKPRADADDAALARRPWAKSGEIVVSTRSSGVAHAPIVDCPLRSAFTPAYLYAEPATPRICSRPSHKHDAHG
jgi:NAD(P)-dependent dehydrogenase (short-subunit alcohol dehydrogenase family)